MADEQRTLDLPALIDAIFTMPTVGIVEMVRSHLMSLIDAGDVATARAIAVLCEHRQRELEARCPSCGGSLLDVFAPLTPR